MYFDSVGSETQCKMRILLIVALYNVLPVTLGQLEFINLDLGDIQFEAKVGTLPPKYIPLTEYDVMASERAADVVDFLPLVPGIDPLERKAIDPIGIDVLLWITGAVAMKNVVLSGVKQLVAHSIEMRLNNLRTDLNASIPVMHFESDFFLDAYLTFFPLTFSCHISANVEDVKVLISAGSQIVQSPQVGEALQVTSAAVNIDIRNVRVNITNMDLNAKIHLGTPYTQLFSGPIEDNIFNGLLKSGLNMINFELMNVPLGTFKTYLTS